MSRIFKLHQRDRFHSSKTVVVDAFDYHIRAGNAYHVADNTANIGAETTPADTIELYFLTPAAVLSIEIVAVFSAFCSTAGAVYTLREAYTGGGGASGDAVTPINLNRSSSNTSALATSIDIQADTITSGGTVLQQETLTAGARLGATLKEEHMWILKAATLYGASIYLNGAGVADVGMHWYER